MPKSYAIALALSSAIALARPGASFAQDPAKGGPVAAVRSIEGEQELLPRLTPAQKQAYDEAAAAYKGQRDAESLALYKQLLKDFPADPYLSKLASEPALNVGDNDFALQVLKPVAQANPGDWQAAMLLTRASAQSGDKAGRDAGIIHLLDLRKRGATPPKLNQYIVERVPVTGGSVVIFTSLQPWSQYNVYNYAQIFNTGGQMILRSTIESDDFDQPDFARQHPQEAAKGMRLFSLDGYSPSGGNGSGQKTETHFTFQFFTGQPDYETARQAFLDVAAGKIKPISSRDNLPVP